MTPHKNQPKNELEAIQQENAALRGCITTVVTRLADYDGYSKAEDLKKLIDGACETLASAYPERVVDNEKQELCPLCLQSYRKGHASVAEDNTYVMKLKLTELNGFNMIGAILSNPATYPIVKKTITALHGHSGLPLGYLVHCLESSTNLVRQTTLLAIESGTIPAMQFCVETKPKDTK